MRRFCGKDFVLGPISIVLVLVMALVSEVALVVLRIWVVLVWFCCSN